MFRQKLLDILRRSYSNTKREDFWNPKSEIQLHSAPSPCCIIVIRLDDGQSLVAETCSLIVAEYIDVLIDEKFIHMRQNLLRICQQLGHFQISYSQCICNAFVMFAKHDQLL